MLMKGSDKQCRLVSVPVLCCRPSPFNIPIVIIKRAPHFADFLHPTTTFLSSAADASVTSESRFPRPLRQLVQLTVQLHRMQLIELAALSVT